MARDSEKLENTDEIKKSSTNEMSAIDVLAQIKEAQEKLDKTSEEIQRKMEELDAKNKLLDDQMHIIEEQAKQLPDISAKELIDDSLSTGELLAKEDKVTLVVPKSELNPQEKMVPVTINGYTYSIRRGEQVTVPQTVADILKEAKYI